MAALAPLLGTLFIAVSFLADQLTLRFTTMISEYQQVRALCAHIKATGKKFADLSGVLMASSWLAEGTIIFSVFGILTQE